MFAETLIESVQGGTATTVNGDALGPFDAIVLSTGAGRCHSPGGRAGRRRLCDAKGILGRCQRRGPHGPYALDRTKFPYED